MRRLRMSHAVAFNCLVAVIMLSAGEAIAQTDSGTVSGRVVDPSGFSVAGAKVSLVDIDRETATTVSTNGAGLYTFHGVHPGRYRMEVAAKGFKIVNITGLTVNTQANLEQNFALSLGSVSESITVEAKAAEISTSVSTVVDRQFVENLPLNGRSFQSLFALTPGLVLTKATATEAGQFSVNGQRADANYLMIDGVSANIGAAPNFLPGQNLAGSVPGLSASGGTNNLASVDALQEFRIQTSSFAPEYGRTPGAQVSVMTRSGTNEFHASLFEYFRNDVLDANDWFSNHSGARKPALRQNDFGGVLGGPILKNRAFFFFSYEGLRLRQPRFVLTSVPTLSVRQNAPAGLRPFLNAFPQPNGPDIINSATGLPTGFAPFNAGFSVPSSFDASSLRVDYALSNKLTLFGRYNYAPSDIVNRSFALSMQNPGKFKTQTLTLGATLAVTPKISNDFRFNYSRNRSTQSFELSDFGGAVAPPESDLFPSFPSTTSELVFNILGGSNSTLIVGHVVGTVQRQFNVVDTVSAVIGSHQTKFGIDYRRLFPVIDPRNYLQNPLFTGMGITPQGITPPPGTVMSGIPASVPILASAGPLFPVFMNFSGFAQDTWRALPRVTLTYGARWELNPAPSESNGNDPYAVAGLDNPLTATLAPRGTRAYETTYLNLAPRVGVAYFLSQRPGRELVMRGGFGVFYDLGNQQAANAYLQGFPFSATKIVAGVPYPLTASQAAAPSLDPNRPVTSMIVFEPNFRLPRTYQWNMAIEQSLGQNQTFSASYVAAIGRELVRPDLLVGTSLGGNLNPAVFSPTQAQVSVLRNTATSDFHSLQLQFQRKLARGLQGLASYSWSHSIDNESNDSDQGNLPAAEINLQAERGPSNFDVRHSFSGVLSYRFPSPARSRLLSALLGNWSIDTIVTARSAFPVNITYTAVTSLGLASLRPDLVPGVPLFLSDPTVAGGKRINPAAFSKPLPPRQGTLGRNALRGFGAVQLDSALRRQFRITEHAQLVFRTDFFNVLNHPNFGDPIGSLPTVVSGLFGHSIQTLAQSLGQGGTSGGFNPLYQLGGPRSIQLSMRLQF